MKVKTIFLIFITLVCNFSYSQSIEDLDIKNGFKSYKLGTSKSTISQNFKLEYINTGKYLVLNNPDKTVFDLNVEELMLEFDELDKLVLIFIKIKKGEKNGEMGLLGSYFTPLFGKETNAGILNEKDGYEMWSGNKVVLLVTYNFIDLYMRWQTFIFIMNKSIYNKKFNNGF